MKIKMMILLLAIILPVSGQNAGDSIGGKKISTTDLVAKPAFEGTVGGYHMKVWIMSAIRGMGAQSSDEVANNDNLQNMDYNIVVEVTEAGSGRSIAGAGVKAVAESPSEKSTEIELDPMMEHYGGSFRVSEKGEYKFNIVLDINGESNSSLFKYNVK